LFNEKESEVTTPETPPPGIFGDGAGDKTGTLYHTKPFFIPTQRKLQRWTHGLHKRDQPKYSGTNPGHHELFFMSQKGGCEFYWVFRSNATPRHIRETARQLKDLLRVAGWWEDKR
jgi:hypothetical protein